MPFGVAPSSSSPHTHGPAALFYSFRNATNGFSRDACWAGIAPATMATKLRSSAPPNQNYRIPSVSSRPTLKNPVHDQGKRLASRNAAPHTHHHRRKHEPHDLRGLCTQRHADSKFARALCHSIGHHAI